MAGKSSMLNHFPNIFLTMIIYTVLEDIVIAFPSSTYIESRQSRSAEKPTSTDQQTGRLHSAVIVSVVIVIAVAVAAAVLIIRKYCCPQSNVTYRYSDLRQMEEQNAAAEVDDDSDEDLLE